MGTHDREREKYVRQFEMVETTDLRACLGAAIEALVDILDRLEPEPDLEPDNDDEPSLGWCNGAPTSRYGGDDDREAEDEHDEDGGDREPSLGAPERAAFRHGWVPAGDGTLYPACNYSQVAWAAGASNDRELGDDNGIADDGGLQEQLRGGW
ncbi:hypothetical protein [Xanthobacter sp. 126]|uniref:hypothetical protein n=1 Tax=Xanthobacter sp. 126 TaxID=1131814 RepID=UPI00045E8264|nr:hypothetical protein [Xanthobacter sp. 126]